MSFSPKEEYNRSTGSTSFGYLPGTYLFDWNWLNVIYFANFKENSEQYSEYNNDEVNQFLLEALNSPATANINGNPGNNYASINKLIN